MGEVEESGEGWVLEQGTEKAPGASGWGRRREGGLRWEVSQVRGVRGVGPCGRKDGPLDGALGPSAELGQVSGLREGAWSRGQSEVSVEAVRTLGFSRGKRRRLASLTGATAPARVAELGGGAARLPRVTECPR